VRMNNNNDDDDKNSSKNNNKVYHEACYPDCIRWDQNRFQSQTSESRNNRVSRQLHEENSSVF
jgi:hypothetical protein